MEEAEYSDKTILELREMYRKACGEKEPVGDEIWIGSSLVAAERVKLLEDKCSMVLPETLEDMPAREREVQYRNKNRPPVIKTTADRTAAFTLDWYVEDKAGEIPAGERLMQIRQDMEKVWKQNVFYDMGIVQAEHFPVAWMDYKAFGVNGSFYGMTFLFEMEKEVLIGNFHCSFFQYDIWKPVLIKLFTTIRSEYRKEVWDASRAD